MANNVSKTPSSYRDSIPGLKTIAVKRLQIKRQHINLSITSTDDVQRTFIQEFSSHHQERSMNKTKRSSTVHDRQHEWRGTKYMEARSESIEILMLVVNSS